jgi:hypothetical protein
MRETRQQFLDRLIGENRAKREQRANPPTQPQPGCVTLKHLIGDVVTFKLGDFFVKGVVTNIHISPCGVAYDVTWSDTRQSSSHYDFELEAVEAD